MKIVLRYLVLTAGMLTGLSACGFHLRAPAHLPAAMAVTYIATLNPGDELVRTLRRELANSNIKLTDDPASATATLHILRSQQKRRVLSVNFQGRPLEYELAYFVSFSVTQGNKTLLAAQNLHLTRSYTADPADVLGSSQEAAMLLKSMQRNLAGLLLDRLAAIKPDKP